MVSCSENDILVMIKINQIIKKCVSKKQIIIFKKKIVGKKYLNIVFSFLKYIYLSYLCLFLSSQYFYYVYEPLSNCLAPGSNYLNSGLDIGKMRGSVCKCLRKCVSQTFYLFKKYEFYITPHPLYRTIVCPILLLSANILNVRILTCLPSL